MKINRLSLRIRIFLSMILLVLLASVLIAAITIYQYKEQTDEYNKGRLERKEQSVLASINYWLEETTFPVIEKNLAVIFRQKIYEIANIEKLEINLYNLKGNLVKSSHSGFVKNDAPNQLSKKLLKAIETNYNHKFINSREKGESSIFLSSYAYIKNNKFMPIGIVNIRYIQDNSAQDKDLREFLYRLLLVYILMFLMAILLAYFLSSYITRSIKAVSDKMNSTALTTKNEKIILHNASKEIHTLVDAYNQMVDELEESALKLAKSEREQAWREMAKQVAHEIKNPLTPMRLTVQSFQRKFNPKEENVTKKVNEFSKMLIQQIDTMSSIASAFSSFAKMPTQKKELLNVVEVIKHTLHVFSKNYISFIPQEKTIKAHLDKTQLTRIITNLTKNAIQALQEKENKRIEVKVFSEQEKITILVSDNGKGISEEDKKHVFEPKFTTKTSGMGLGLAMVKKIVEAYEGNVTFTSKKDKGTVFKVELPKK